MSKASWKQYINWRNCYVFFLSNLQKYIWWCEDIYVWIALKTRDLSVFFFFVGPVYCSRDPQVLILEKKILTRFHGTIHTFKNYFTTIFSIFSNKRYLNRLIINKMLYVIDSLSHCHFSRLLSLFVWSPTTILHVLNEEIV